MAFVLNEILTPLLRPGPLGEIAACPGMGAASPLEVRY